MDTWAAICKFLAEHHGVIDRTALENNAVTKHQLEMWVREGRLERCAPRVWRLAGSPVTWEQRLTKGLLSLGPTAAVSHRAAARLHQFDRAPAHAVEFLVPAGLRHSNLDERVHSTSQLGGHDVITIEGFRVTSPTRTIFDLAADGASEAQVKAAIDSAVRTQRSAPEAILRRLGDLRRRGLSGVRLVQRLLVDAGGHTMLERMFLELVREAGLPRPTPQVVFRSGDARRTIARVDFLYRDWDLVVEVSGRLGHSTPTERANDAQRRNELQVLGLRVYDFTWEQVKHRGPWVQARMCTLLQAAGWPG